jgi:hypothetical protein
MTLFDEARTFLSANGWLVTQTDPVLICGTRPGLGDVSDQVLVWVPQTYDPEQLRMREDGYLRRFEEHAQTQGQKFLLVDSMEGLSTEFRRRAFREFGVSLTVPTDFFDAPFKWELSRSAATAASSMRSRGLVDRIPQPFTSSSEYSSHDDLLAALLPAFRPLADGPPVHLVTAPAGFGKSHLFRSLFTRLHSDFINAKSARIWALRPLPLLPEYLASAAAPTLKALVASFLSTEIARPLTMASFEWMLTHGYACFLLDGLDEVIARDPHFFEYMYDLLTRSDAPYPPKILMCVRDSLLVSSKGLRDFLDDAGDELVARHRLAAWQRPSVGAYVRRNLDVPKAATLMKFFSKNKNLLQLAGTPFYCEALTTEVGFGIDQATLADATSETRLLALAVRRMVQREFDNGMLQQHWASVEDIGSLIQDIAEENLEGGAKGVRVDDVAELAMYSLAPDLPENEVEDAVQQIQQLPFFTGAVDLGRLSFSQEVIYDYLLGIRAAEYFASNPKRFLHLLGVHPLSSGSATLHVIQERILSSNGLDDLYRAAMDAAPDRLAFRNVLQVILGLPGTEWIVRRLPLERGDLSALRFTNLDLSTVSFRGSNLEASSFEGCSLQKAVLADAVLKGTSFDNCKGMNEIDFGDLSTFFSASVGGGTFEEPDDFLIASGAAKAPEGRRYVRPCAAANQLRFLFGKYVRPDGAARRDWLDERAAVAGRRYVDPKPVVDAARRHGYLEWDASRKRYVRSRGDDYSDMVGLVSKLQITPKLRLLLSDVCRQQGCSHLLEIETSET